MKEPSTTPDKHLEDETKYLVLNLPDTAKYFIDRSWAGTFGTGRLKHQPEDGRFLPIWLLYAASALKNSQTDFTLLDAQAKGFDSARTVAAVEKENPDIVIAMPCLPSYTNDLALLDMLKTVCPTTKLVLLGGVVNVVGEKIFRDSNVDYLITGRYPFYNNLIELITNHEHAKGITYRKKNGGIITNPKLDDTNDLNNINFDTYQLIDVNTYTMRRRDKHGNIVKWIPLLTGAGCPYTCGYCPYPLTYGRKFMYKDIALAIEEIRYILDRFDINGFCMRDVVFTQNRDRVITFCTQLLEKKLHIKYLFETRVDLLDKELIHLLQKTGCYQINFGVETGNAQMLKNVGKPGVNIEKLKETFKLTRDAGIINMAHIILGLPGETKATIKQTYKLLLEIKADGVNLNYITPYPGTKLYEYAVANNLIVDTDWSNYTSHNIVMRSKDLSIEDLQRIGERLRKKYAIYKLLTNKHSRNQWVKKYLQIPS